MQGNEEEEEEVMREAGSQTMMMTMTMTMIMIMPTPSPPSLAPQVAVVTNPSGVTRELRLGVDVLVEQIGGAAAGANENKRSRNRFRGNAGTIVAVLGPEHGFRGIAPAGKSQVRAEARWHGSRGCFWPDEPNCSCVVVPRPALAERRSFS